MVEGSELRAPSPGRGPARRGTARSPAGLMVLSLSLQLSLGQRHMFKTASRELCPSDGTSQRTAAVPAKAPGAARLSLSVVCLARLSTAAFAEGLSVDC